MELPDIQTGLFLYLLQAVDERVAVHVQPAGGLGDIEIVVQKTVDDVDCFRLEEVRRVRAQHFFQIRAAPFPGETVDEAADAQLIIWIDILAGIEDFADVQGETGFLIGTRKLVEVLCDSAVGNVDPDERFSV